MPCPVCIHHPHLRPTPKSSVGKTKRWKKKKIPSSKHKQLLTTWFEKWIASGRSYRAAKWWVPTGRANSAAPRRQVTMWPAHVQCSQHDATAMNHPQTLYKLSSCQHLPPSLPFPSHNPFPNWNKRWSLKPGLYDFPCCKNRHAPSSSRYCVTTAVHVYST